MSEHDPLRLGCYSLGALEPTESREIEGHLTDCAECRQELAELDEMKELLGEVPPEAFLDGPPPDGGLMLQRTLRKARAIATAEVATQPAVLVQAPRKARSRWYLAAAAVTMIAGALGSGVLIGHQTVGQVDVALPAGAKQVTGTSVSTSTTMQTTVEPRPGWSWITVDIAGLKAGAECQMLVTDLSGKTLTAGSWVVSDSAARDGSHFSGGVLIPIDKVKSVEVQTVAGAPVIVTQV